MSGPAPRDLEIYRGDDYAHKITFVDNSDPPEPLNLSGYTFKAQIRDRPENGISVLSSFTIDTSDAASGIITLHLNAAETEIPSGYWDLEVNDGSVTQTWLRGKVTMSGDVTREVSP